MSNLIALFKQSWKDTFIAPKTSIKEEKPRIQFIDLAKGICILLVCIEHSQLRGIMPDMFCMLRMPLYFVLSGLFFKDYGGLLHLTERKINKIIIPAVFFYSISFPLYKLCEHFGFMEDKGASYISIFFNDIKYCLPVWFLFSLFFCNIFFCIIYRLSKGKTLPIFIGCLVCSCLGYILYSQQTRLFLYMDTSLSMMPFFFFGWWLRKINILLPNSKDKILFFISIGVILSLGLAESHLGNYRIDFIYNDLPGKGIFLSFAFGGTLVLSTLFILKRIVWLPFISYFGRYSIIVLLIHSQLIAAFRGVLGEEREILVVIFTILICWLAIPVIKKYMPHVSAQKDWFVLPFKNQLGMAK